MCYNHYAIKSVNKRCFRNGVIKFIHSWYKIINIGCGYYDNNTDGIIGIQKEINDIIVITCVYAMVIWI